MSATQALSKAKSNIIRGKFSSCSAESESSNGGILPAVDSSPSLSSGYRGFCTNSKGLDAAHLSFEASLKGELCRPISLLAPFLLIPNYIRNLAIQFVFSIFEGSPVDNDKATAFDPNLRAEARRQLDQQWLCLAADLDRVQILSFRLQYSCNLMAIV